jgi:hypothetical protein
MNLITRGLKCSIKYVITRGLGIKMVYSPPPDCRLELVSAEGRIESVAAESRIESIALENRMEKVEC